MVAPFAHEMPINHFLCCYCGIFIILIYLCDAKSYTGALCDLKGLSASCRPAHVCPKSARLMDANWCNSKLNYLVCCNATLLQSGLSKRKLSYNQKLFKRSTIAGKSREMCEKYAEAVYTYETPPILLDGAQKVKKDNCGVRETPLIVGGELAHTKEFPHMALIGHSESEVIYWQCGGSLISHRWVLSAAHCTASSKGLAKWATLGDLKVLSNLDDDYTRPITLAIVERKNHPEYNRQLGYHDIALYKLEKDVQFNAYIRPICLDTQPTHTHYSGKAIATGWGNTRWKGVSSNDLLKVTLNIYDSARCDNLYRNSKKPKLIAKIPNGITSDRLVCAWEQGKDTCQGDSGGPLQIKLSTPYCMYSIIGITSFGDECARDLPGIYTRVSYYLPWIEPIVWPSR